MRPPAPLLAALLAAAADGSRFMKCGEGVPLCGVLTLESGFGRNRYHHPEPVVHGLWPQVGHYGTSECIHPKREGPTRKIYSCYREAGSARNQILWFEGHEWTSHGRCAGAADEDDFFAQVCALSDRPLEIMEDARPGGLEAMVAAVRAAGLPVYTVDSYNDQIELSACAGADGRWRLAPVGKFQQVCGSGGPPHGEGVCVPNHHGPRCHSDSQCLGVPGCARCARSGYCTNLPLTTELAEASSSPVPLLRARPRLPRLALAVLLVAGLTTGLLAAGAWRRWGGGEVALGEDSYLSI